MHALLSVVRYCFSPQGTVAALVVSGFITDPCSKPDPGAVGRQSQWLLELMGHQKNLASKSIPTPEDMQLCQVTEPGRFM